MDQLKSVRSKLKIALKFDMNWLASEMEATGILGSDDYERITDSKNTLDASDRMEILIASLFGKVHLNCSYLDNVVVILKKKPKNIQRSHRNFGR